MATTLLGNDGSFKVFEEFKWFRRGLKWLLRSYVFEGFRDEKRDILGDWGRLNVSQAKSIIFGKINYDLRTCT